MKAYISAQTAEPVGIVISRGDRSDPAPFFAAWIHAPSPVDVEVPASAPKAA